MGTQTGYVQAGKARLYYETAGAGQPLVFIHAGVADSRQWEGEFAHFARAYRVLRYDLRGYGKSLPVEGEYSHMGDLLALLDQLDLHQPLVLVGCSMGGSLAMDFALAHPSRVRALVMVGSGPSDLDLDVPGHPKMEAAQAAYKAGDLDRLAELETQIWFDGMDRTPEQVDQPMRRLALEMNHLALAHEAKGLGKRLPDTAASAIARLDALKVPVLVIVGAHDIPYLQAAADFMLENLPSARKVTIADAAHLPNMDHPRAFQRVVEAFLEEGIMADGEKEDFVNTNSKENQGAAHEGALLTGAEQALCRRIAAAAEPPHSQRAAALLVLDAGATRAQAAEGAGLTLGSLKYWLARFRAERLGIFPALLLAEAEMEVEAAQAEAAAAEAAVEPEAVKDETQPAKEQKKPKAKKGKKAKKDKKGKQKDKKGKKGKKDKKGRKKDKKGKKGKKDDKGKKRKKKYKKN